MNYNKLHNDLIKLVGFETEFTVKFIKKDETGRIMTGFLAEDCPMLPYGYLHVIEKGDKQKSVSLDRLVSLEIDGKFYTINQEKSEWVFMKI